MTMSRPAPVLSLGLALGALLVAAPARADLPEMQRRGTLRVLVVDEDLFFSLKPNTLPGFDREVLEGFAQLNKLKLEVVALPGWDQMIPALLEGKGDLIAGGYAVTEARRKQIEFSGEVFPSRKVVMTRRPHPPITTLTDFRAARVGTVKGTSMAEAVAAAGVPEANVAYLASGTLPAALKAGKVSAVVLGVEHAILARRDDPEIELGLFLGTPGSLAYGLRKEDSGLKQALDGYVENLRRTPSWSRLVVKYLGQSAPDVLKQARSAQ